MHFVAEWIGGCDTRADVVCAAGPEEKWSRLVVTGGARWLTTAGQALHSRWTLSLPRSIRQNELDAYEVVVPFAHGRTSATPVSSVRSSLLAASLGTIRQMGWEDRYYKVLAPNQHDAMQSLIAGEWVPLALATAHYTACDRMMLTPADMTKIGEEVSRRTQKSFVAVAARVSAEAGATGWTVLTNFGRIWERIFEGGDIAVYKVGPKEAYCEAVNCPLLQIPYFRVSSRSYFRLLVAFVTKTAYATDVTRLTTEANVVFRFSWV